VRSGDATGVGISIAESKGVGTPGLCLRVYRPSLTVITDHPVENPGVYPTTGAEQSVDRPAHGSIFADQAKNT
jgi:hypothetical protein